uniref:Fibronectin type-III domain-containing protein n=1 Tax=Heterorhabditis bacteriophora TaxID=37862 RepID=A0A1I7X0N9_HETBA
MKYLILTLTYLAYFIRSQELSNQKRCLFRCIANCLNKSKNSLYEECKISCTRYDDRALCNNAPPTCWDACDDLGPSTSIAQTQNFTLDNYNGMTIISWNPVSGATFYVLQYKNINTINFDEDRYEAMSPNGFGPFTKSKRIESPHPSVDPLLQLVGIQYINEPFVTDFYNANGTIEIIFSFAQNGKMHFSFCFKNNIFNDLFTNTYSTLIAVVILEWPLGDKDIDVVPMFHLINCAEPDLSQSVPLPEFVKGLSPNTLVGRLGSDMMYRRCRFLYYIQSVSSRTCRTVHSLRSPPSKDMQTLTINCEIVENNPCPKISSYEAPLCGQVNDVQYTLVDAHVASKSGNLTLNVTFDPIVRDVETPTLYYLAFYGNALPYETKEQETFLGVNITEIVGKTSNCLEFNLIGFCAKNTTNSVIVTDLQWDTLYGITFCAVKDPRNLTVPNFQEVTKAFKPKADKILIHSKDYLHKLSSPLTNTNSMKKNYLERFININLQNFITKQLYYMNRHFIKNYRLVVECNIRALFSLINLEIYDCHCRRNKIISKKPNSADEYRITNDESVLSTILRNKTEAIESYRNTELLSKENGKWKVFPRLLEILKPIGKYGTKRCKDVYIKDKFEDLEIIKINKGLC